MAWNGNSNLFFCRHYRDLLALQSQERVSVLIPGPVPGPINTARVLTVRFEAYTQVIWGWPWRTSKSRAFRHRMKLDQCGGNLSRFASCRGSRHQTEE